MIEYFVVTLHWIHTEPLQRCQVILDYFTVNSGKGVSARCAVFLEGLAEDFGLTCKITISVTDNKSDAISTAVNLGRSLALTSDAVLVIDPNSLHIWCWVHSIQLGIRKAGIDLNKSLRKMLKISTKNQSI